MSSLAPPFRMLARASPLSCPDALVSNPSVSTPGAIVVPEMIVKTESLPPSASFSMTTVSAWVT